MAALSVEHLKVMAALTVEPAYAFNLLIGWGGLDGGLISRAPKGDGGLNSRACLRILSMAALTVEHLKVMAALTVEHANAFNLLICPSNKSKNGRAPKGPLQFTYLPLK